MVTLDARDVGALPEDRSTRRYTAADADWAAGLLEQTLGRYRFRRGSIVDAANLPGLVALVGNTAAGITTILSHREELEIVAASAQPGDESTIGQLLRAVIDTKPIGCRRIFMVCYNAELGMHRLVQQHGFRLCTSRPGSVVNARKLPHGASIPATVGGVPVRDEVEFDLLLS